MADISKITLPGGAEYDIKDATARAQITALSNYVAFLGVTTTALTDGASTSPIVIGGENVTPVTGNVVTYGSKEFIYNGTKWQEFGDLTGLGDLAFKSSAQALYTPAGSVSQPTTTVTTSSTTVNSITDVGTLPSFTVSGETLNISPGTLPTKGSNTTVVQSITGATTTKPTFSGTQTTITVS